jgi:hypothetical protein
MKTRNRSEPKQRPASPPRWQPPRLATARVRAGSGAVVMTAANASPFPFRLLWAVSDARGWTGLRPAGWRQLHDLRAMIGSRA